MDKGLLKNERRKFIDKLNSFSANSTSADNSLLCFKDFNIFIKTPGLIVNSSCKYNSLKNKIQLETLKNSKVSLDVNCECKINCLVGNLEINNQPILEGQTLTYKGGLEIESLENSIYSITYSKI